MGRLAGARDEPEGFEEGRIEIDVRDRLVDDPAGGYVGAGGDQRHAGGAFVEMELAEQAVGAERLAVVGGVSTRVSPARPSRSSAARTRPICWSRWVQSTWWRRDPAQHRRVVEVAIGEDLAQVAHRRMLRALAFAEPRRQRHVGLAVEVEQALRHGEGRMRAETVGDHQRPGPVTGGGGARLQPVDGVARDVDVIGLVGGRADPGLLGIHLPLADIDRFLAPTSAAAC